MPFKLGQGGHYGVPTEAPESRRRLVRLGFGLEGLGHMLGISITPDGVCVYAEYIRPTPDEKLILRIYGPSSNFSRPLPSCQPVQYFSYPP